MKLVRAFGGNERGRQREMKRGREGERSTHLLKFDRLLFSMDNLEILEE
jgi:hypothetical protein